MHTPVLKNEVEHYLNAAAGGKFFDGTVGLGGHSMAILQASPENYLYGSDKDNDALLIAKKNLEPFQGRFTLFHSDFRELAMLAVPIREIDAFLFDLGVSSFQLDDEVKGFSYAQNGPLDMRMNKKQHVTAAEVVNQYPYEKLMEILALYGEFKHPGPIVEQIIFHRRLKKIETTGELKTIIRRIMPKQKTMDPLARVFQAIRIEVNQELEQLEDFFLDLIYKMKHGSRLAIISFHSLEDRIAKSIMKKGKEEGVIELLCKKPIIPGDEEMKTNARARSAKLRVGMRIN